MKRTKVIDLSLLFLLILSGVFLWESIPNLLKTIRDESAFIQGITAFVQLVWWSISSMFFMFHLLKRVASTRSKNEELVRVKPKCNPSRVNIAQAGSGAFISQGDNNANTHVTQTIQLQDKE